MLSVQLACVGKLKEGFYRQACAEYQKRLGAYCRLEVVEVAECRLPANPSPGQIARALEQERRALEGRIHPAAQRIALCIEGKPMSSEAFSALLETWCGQGMSRLCLLIGGSVGLSEEIKRSARLRLSFSQMTFPHHLARVMALEQLYRALNLAAGGGYHK